MNATSPYLKPKGRTEQQAQADVEYGRHRKAIQEVLQDMQNRGAPIHHQHAVMYALEDMIARQAERILKR